MHIKTSVEEEFCTNPIMGIIPTSTLLVLIHVQVTGTSTEIVSVDLWSLIMSPNELVQIFVTSQVRH
jgi:hypothetical protein